MRKIFISIIFILCFSTFANGQGAIHYKFLEVIDSANKPVANAKVKVQGGCAGDEILTNKKVNWIEDFHLVLEIAILTVSTFQKRVIIHSLIYLG